MANRSDLRALDARRGRAVAASVRGPGWFGRRADEPFPAGVWVDVARDVRRPSPAVLFGGTPPRMVRLSPRGAALLSGFATAPVGEGASAGLARRLTDAGIAVPRPDGLRSGGPGVGGAHQRGPVPPADVTVVIPVRDRPVELAGCLAALDHRYQVVVVDDGSVDASAVAAVCRRHGAALVRREVSGGPAAARNTGLRTVTSELVAFVDSDCACGPGAVESLAAHFVDPLVVGVAPRIVAAAPSKGASLLDLGARPAPVHPRSGVPYVPAAAVVFRRAALGDGFDERLRYGEDVDLVWRLVEAGWRIRYEPSVEVGHRDPRTIVRRCRRRFLYGTSVGQLDRAHPGAVDHLVVGPGPAITVGGMVLGAPVLATGAWAVAAARLYRRLRPLGVGRRFALWLSGAQVLHAWTALGKWCTTFGVPLLAGVAVSRRIVPPRRRARARGAAGPHRARWTLVVLVLTTLVADRLGPNGHRGRVVVDGCFGELAYGLGVVTGCARAGVVKPLLPRIGRRRGDAGDGRRRTRRRVAG